MWSPETPVWRGMALQPVGLPPLNSGVRRAFVLVGDTGIEPVTSTVSRCRATGTDDGITAFSWACRDRRPPALPVLTLIPPLSVGTLWGQLWGHDLGAARRVEPQVGRVTARRGHGVLTWVFGWPVVAVVDRWLPCLMTLMARAQGTLVAPSAAWRLLRSCRSRLGEFDGDVGGLDGGDHEHAWL
jgi:hypothetical protein